MHKQLFRLLLLLTIVLAVFCISSCKKLTEDPDVANALIGLWRYKQSTVDLTVGGVELIEYLTLNFGYSQDEAEVGSDSISSVLSANSNGTTIIINGDKTFQLIKYNQNDKNGSWSINSDGQELNLNLDNEVEILQILTLTAQTLKVKLPTDSENFDFDNDGIDETSLDINVEQTLTKSSNGGAGG